MTRPGLCHDQLRSRVNAALAAALVVGFFATSGFAQDKPASAGDRFADKPIAGRANQTGAAGASNTPPGPSGSRVIVSLGAVAVMIVGLGWAYRRLFAAQQQKGGGAVTLVSRSLVTPRHQVFVLRVGHRLLVVGDSGQGMNRLGEITDPAEVSAVLGDATGGPEMDILRGQAFGATLDGATGDYEGDAFPGHEADPIEHARTDEGRDGERGDVQGEVRSLLERVRGLAGQIGGGAPAESSRPAGR